MPNSVQFTQTLRQWMDIFMHRSWRGMHHFAKSTGLSMPQFSIMMQLHYRGACGVSEISERFDVTTAAASQLVDKLVQAGYLERTEDPSDRRAKLLTLSIKGKGLIEQGIDERYRWMDDLAAGLSPEHQKNVADSLELLTAAVQKMDRQA